MILDFVCNLFILFYKLYNYVLVIVEYLNLMDYLELIGWIGNVFVVISFLNNDTLKLRSYNLVGASLWLVYGIVAGSFSIIFLNVVVISIQIVKITQILRERKKS